MHIEQIYTKCLSQGAYYIHSDGEAAIIDPLREIAPYLERAKADKVNIKYIFETHFHADFVSGHVSLSEETNAPIVYGPLANPSFKAHIAKDGEEFKVGKLTIKALHTPGHTMESTTYLLLDEKGKEHAIFSGDTLFLGDVGRPDLAQKSASMTQEELAGTLYDSLRNKIMPLPDEVIVYPAHGAGSACGKNMSKETVDTLGNQKKTNYALRADMTKEEFIQEVTDGLAQPPQYFPLNVQMNKEGYDHIEEVLARGLQGIEITDLEDVVIENHALILDVRNQFEFAEAHIPNSMFLGLNGGFAPWAGELIVDTKQAIVLVCNEGQEKEAVTRLARVGFDNVLGYIQGGVSAWKTAGNPIATIESITAEDFVSKYESIKNQIFDVRKEGEFLAQHIEGANYTTLSKLGQFLEQYPKDKTAYVHCAGGYRSVIACSILKANGIHNVINILGGFGAIKQNNIPLSENVCPSTLQ